MRASEDQSVTPRAAGSQLVALDMVRALAALVVFLGHVRIVFLCRGMIWLSETISLRPGSFMRWRDLVRRPCSSSSC